VLSDPDQGEVNDEVRSDRYRKRGHFSCDRWGGDGECTVLSPLPFGPAGTYTSQAYTSQSRGSVRREGVPRTVPFSDPYSPAANGGGSLGYNQKLPR